MDNLNKAFREHLKEHNVPFQYGKNDCVIFAFGWVKKCTGIDLYKLRPTNYTTELGSIKAMKKLGANSLQETIDLFLERRLGIPKRGDICLHKDTKSLGICFGNMSAFLGDKGIVYARTKECIAFWRAE